MLSTGSIIRMDPNCPIDPAPFNYLRIGNSLTRENSLNAIDIVPYKLQRLGH